MQKITKKLISALASGMLIIVGTSSASATSVFTQNLGAAAAVTSNTSWQLDSSNGPFRMQFDLDRSVIHTLTFDLVVTGVNTSGHDCLFQTGPTSFVTTDAGLTISRLSRQGDPGITDTGAISCQIVTTSGFNLTTTEFIATPSSNLGDAPTARVPISFTGTSGGTPPVQSSDTAVPAKYSGPEFSGLSAKGIMVGTSPRLEGKNLNEISSIEIGGKAATFTLDGDKALDLTLPEGLAPGLYDLVINSSAGKLTHINAIQVREPRRAFSVTTRSEGRISEDQYREHTIISAMQIPELNKARCIVNGSNLALAKAQAERLCALVAAANPNIETTVIEPRSTVRNNSVFARVTYGWN